MMSAVSTNTTWLTDAIAEQTANAVYDPHDIAAGIIEDIPNDELRQKYAMAGLVYEIRVFFHNERTAARSSRRTNFNPRQVSAQEWEWPVGGVWKPVSEFTLEDVELMIEDYCSKARDLSAQANRWEELKRLMVRHKAKRVKNLPPSVDIGEVLGGSV
jgi:hypothetical protein